MGDILESGVSSLILRERREKIVKQMADFIKEANDPATSEARKTELISSFDRAEKDEAEISALIQRTEKAEKLFRESYDEQLETADRAGRDVRSKDKNAEYRDAFNAWFAGRDLTQEQRAAMAEFRGTNTQVVGTGNLGGYLVPTGFWPEITKSLLSYSGIVSAARIWQTASGNTTYKPTLDDTSPSAVLVAESGALTVQDLTFGQKQFDAYKYASLAKVSWEAMQDPEFSFEDEIRDAFVPRFGRAMNSSCTTGTGSSQPNGVVTAASLGKTAASATAFTRPEIVDLIHSVDPEYRMSVSGKVGLMMNDSVLAAVKKLALGTGDATPLWQRSMREGEPDTIEGYRYWINQGMASALTTGQKIMLFGDFDAYVIRLVKSMEIARLNELYAGNGQVGFYGFMRWDGECVNTSAIKYMALA